MNTRTFVLIGLTVLFLCAETSPAQDTGTQNTPRRGCQNRFISLDANGDGKVTKEEFMGISHRRPNPEERFNTLDADGNGYLTVEEFCSK